MVKIEMLTKTNTGAESLKGCRLDYLRDEGFSLMFEILDIHSFLVSEGVSKVET